MRLAELERYREADIFAGRTVETYRLLIQFEREGYLPMLAVSLTALGGIRSQVGVRNALALIEEDVELFRGPVRVEPEKYLPEYVDALTDVAIYWLYAEKRRRGVASATEAVRICKRLAANYRPQYRKHGTIRLRVAPGGFGAVAMPGGCQARVVRQSTG